MAYYVYILQSKTNKKYYTGHTQNLERRLHKHNHGQNKSTKSGIPWKIIYSEILNSKTNAYRREMQIKKYKSGKAFKKLIKK